MSRSFSGSKSPGSEWWGKRPLSSLSYEYPYSKFWKRQLHKKERKQGKQVAQENDKDE